MSVVRKTLSARWATSAHKVSRAVLRAQIRPPTTPDVSATTVGPERCPGMASVAEDQEDAREDLPWLVTGLGSRGSHAAL